MRAGCAKRDISPRQPSALYGYPHVERISTGVHDQIWATAVVIEAEEITLAIVSLDVLMIEPSFARRIRTSAAEAVGCSESSVFIGCTHTHSGPVTSRLIAWQEDPAVPVPDPEYMDFLAGQTVSAVTAAARSLVSAELAWTSVEAPGVGGNRLSTEGATDAECGILAIRRGSDNGLMALNIIYGMHPTVLHEDSTLISSDFPHFVRRHICEQLGSDIVVAYHTAPCGNQSPRYFVTGQTFAEAERLGRTLGSAICTAICAFDESRWVATDRLAGRRVAVELKRNPVRTSEDAEELLSTSQHRFLELQRNEAPHAEVRTAECEVFGAEGAVVLSRLFAHGKGSSILSDYTPVEIQVLRIGEVFLAGIQGECFTEYSLEIKRRAAAETFVVSLVNGDLQGYIVTPEVAEVGGYEAATAIFAAESGSIMVEALIKCIAEMQSSDDRDGGSR